jgi:prepilin-type N-terminal cleavage/methylation domain-containing protein
MRRIKYLPAFRHDKKNSKGFTLVEIVVTIFVLSFAVIGVYNAFSKIVVLTSGAANRFTAAYLAQEGMEIVRNIRDGNWVNNRGWQTGFPECPDGFEADYRIGAYVSCYGGKDLDIDSNGFYVYSGNENPKTTFKRKIKITATPNPEVPDAPYAVEVYVEVSFDQKPGVLNPLSEPGVIVVKEYLYNWYQ